VTGRQRCHKLTYVCRDCYFVFSVRRIYEYDVAIAIAILPGCPSVTLVDHAEMVRDTNIRFSPYSKVKVCT